LILEDFRAVLAAVLVEAKPLRVELVLRVIKIGRRTERAVRRPDITALEENKARGEGSKREDQERRKKESTYIVVVETWVPDRWVGFLTERLSNFRINVLQNQAFRQPQRENTTQTL
jgi:hypothetical protein